MLVAGALGALAANVLPLQTLVDLEPTVASLVLVALVGIFLPFLWLSTSLWLPC